MQIVFDTQTVVIVVGCSFGATAVGLICGFFIGRWFTLAHEPRKLRKDRERTMEALTSLLSSTDKLNEDVDVHNARLFEAEKDISQLKAEGDVENLQSRLLTNIASMVQSNRELEDELVLSRYKLQKQAQELDQRKKEARTDPLCQIGNRKSFDEALDYMLTRKGAKGADFALMLIDVDHFKRINDTFGHSAGDNVLIKIGNVLKQVARSADVVCRLGGDEFAILLDDVSKETFAILGARIRYATENLDFYVGDNDETTVVTLSMGITGARPGDTPLSIFERADEALYESKSLGRNRLTVLQDRGGEAPEAGTGGEVEHPRKSYTEIKLEMLGEIASIPGCPVD